MTTIRSEHPDPSCFLLHVSDTHLRAEGRVGGVLDAEARTRGVFEQIRAAGGSPDAIVVTGDLADHGEADAYAALRALVDPVAASLGTRMIWVMGNHDDRANLREYLRGDARTGEPLDEVHWIGGLRIIVLDTTVPGYHHGELSDDQLRWLAGELAVPAPDGTLLAMHHPPVPCVQNLAALVELRGQSRLADVVRGSDVRSILAGHLHYSTTATFAGIPVSVASATCYTQDLTRPVDAASGIRPTMGRDGAQTYNMVHVYPGTVLHTVVPAAGGDLVGERVDAEEVARRLSAAGHQTSSTPATPALASAR
ncbi:phosphodiesterase [Tersicoccus phoenicis]|uniref:Phosphodiesterase n=1 Tax=Tersicoccus phoenicis TaxID=554083 RepID=A0A1R1L7U8_9MICC|nr:phosphodiesterase [Tersicoccus phoenicis]OMH23614.1 phosphodiesterase [Tersicoccus phoenicis]